MGQDNKIRPGKDHLAVNLVVMVLVLVAALASAATILLKVADITGWFA